MRRCWKVVEHLEAVVGGDGGHGGGGTGDASKKDAYCKKVNTEEDAQDANGRAAKREYTAVSRGAFGLASPYHRQSF